jgi:hypothetical protein
MAIPPVTAVIPVQQIDAIAASDAYRDAPILQARVTEMISDTLARLSIEGKTVDVATLRPLPVGTTLALKGEWRDGQLRLVVQDPATQGGSTGTTPQGAGAQLPNSQNAPAAAQQITVTRPAQATLSSPALPVAAPPAQSAGQSTAQPSLNVPSPVRTAMAHIQAMAVEAMLDGVGGQETQATPKPVIPGQVLADVAARQPLTEGATQRDRIAPGLSASQLAGTLAGLPVEADTEQKFARPQQAGLEPATRPPLPQPTAPHGPATSSAAWAAGQQGAISEDQAAWGEKAKAPHATKVAADAQPLPDAPRAERLVTTTIHLPLHLPGTETPLRLQITREEKEGAGGEAERTGRDPSWIVRFSSETGQLGMIHAAISLVDGHVGVQLWAEQDDTAEWFRDHSRQLRDALVASDLDLDAVRISHGNPLTLESV